MGDEQKTKPPKPSVVKMLFALTSNTCYYTGCENRLTDPTWKSVRADIAHIMGEKPTAARFDQRMGPDDRRAFDNLMIMCPNCHRLIDVLDADGHPPELLFEMKAKKEQQAPGQPWTTDEELERFADMIVRVQVDVIVRRDATVSPATIQTEGRVNRAGVVTPVGWPLAGASDASIAITPAGDENEPTPSD